MSEALGWPGDQLSRIAEGEHVPDPDADDPVIAELDALKADLASVVRRLDAIEHRLALDAEQP
ncbi:hypothetical protein BJF78_17315 [Pseudonocardia sp. CNS-139]|nr:hypothetical protein BJF78_17315 [Pseudonocardia sp. CNS-139]